MNPALLALILTQAQVNCLNASYNEGVKYGLGRTFQAVVLVESSGCVNEVGDDGLSVGGAQIQIRTASVTCSCSVNGERLRTDRNYNLNLGAQFLASCFSRFWPDKRRSLYCYNAGLPKASKASAREIENSRYVRKVLDAERMLQSLPLDTE